MRTYARACDAFAAACVPEFLHGGRGVGGGRERTEETIVRGATEVRLDFIPLYMTSPGESGPRVII